MTLTKLLLYTGGAFAAFMVAKRGVKGFSADVKASFDNMKSQLGFVSGQEVANKAKGVTDRLFPLGSSPYTVIPWQEEYAEIYGDPLIDWYFEIDPTGTESYLTPEELYALRYESD